MGSCSLLFSDYYFLELNKKSRGNPTGVVEPNVLNLNLHASESANSPLRRARLTGVEIAPEITDEVEARPGKYLCLLEPRIALDRHGEI